MLNDMILALWFICSCIAYGAAKYGIDKKHKSWSLSDKLGVLMLATILGPIAIGYILAELTEKKSE